VYFEDKAMEMIESKGRKRKKIGDSQWSTRETWIPRYAFQEERKRKKGAERLL
jgi:hypothetical protein